MRLRIRELIEEIPASSEAGVYNVEKVEGRFGLYAGRDCRGHASVLIATLDAARTVPMKLAGIEAHFSAPCQVMTPGKQPCSETLTSIVCTAEGDQAEAYFATILEAFLPLLDDRATTTAVAAMVHQLVDLFQKLRTPARRSLIGLVGELIVIFIAADTAAAVRAWRSQGSDSFDFTVGRLRIDTKASGRRDRVHEISFDQANPPENTIGLIASVWVEPSGGGMSLAELVMSVEERLKREGEAIAKLRTVVADSLGDTLPAAMEWRFDKRLAVASVALYPTDTIPAIRPPLANGVLSVRFVADLSRTTPAEVQSLISRTEKGERGVLPAAGYAS